MSLSLPGASLETIELVDDNQNNSHAYLIMHSEGGPPHLKKDHLCFETRQEGVFVSMCVCVCVCVCVLLLRSAKRLPLYSSLCMCLNKQGV